MIARFNAAYEFLKREPTVDPARIGAIGYCFGGAVVLTMARQGADLKGVASFHGSLVTKQPAEPGRVKAKVLVLHGQDDSHITKEQVAAFKEEMTRAGADFRFISYPGAQHGFTNPEADHAAKKFGMGVAYNRDADMKSWDEMKRFFRSVFAK